MASDEEGRRRATEEGPRHEAERRRRECDGRGTRRAELLRDRRVLALGGYRVVVGAISPGELVVFITYLKTTFKPLRDLAKHTGRISRAAASGERIADTLDQAVPVTDRSWARPLPPLPSGAPRGALVLDDLWVRYPGGKHVLRGAQLRVAPGERVAIVGPSGAGKSTLMQVLLRFLEPEAGTVRLDGHEHGDLTTRSVREACAVVLQENAIFAGTLAENVRMGRLDAGDDVVQDALRAAALGELLDHEDGIHRPVSEKGSTLSGGERQRLAVARALVRDPWVVLLDEPTTGLDERSADVVLDALLHLAQGRTTLLVTHDPRLLRHVDRVIELRDGHLVERGAAHVVPDSRSGSPRGGSTPAPDEAVPC